jgi:hypothetical protein
MLLSAVTHIQPGVVPLAHQTLSVRVLIRMDFYGGLWVQVGAVFYVSPVVGHPQFQHEGLGSEVLHPYVVGL